MPGALPCMRLAKRSHATGESDEHDFFNEGSRPDRGQVRDPYRHGWGRQKHRVAERLGWAYVDTDHLIESTYGARLQDVTDALDKERFLDVEARVIQSLRMQRAVLATGGSVVYRPEAMRYLTSLGPVVFLDVPLPLILERISRKPDRGLAIAPGQTVEDLFREREALYRQWATCRVAAGDIDVSETANAVFDAIAGCGQAL